MATLRDLMMQQGGGIGGTPSGVGAAPDQGGGMMSPMPGATMGAGTGPGGSTPFIGGQGDPNFAQTQTGMGAPVGGEMMTQGGPASDPRWSNGTWGTTPIPGASPQQGSWNTQPMPKYGEPSQGGYPMLQSQSPQMDPQRRAMMSQLFGNHPAFRGMF